MATVGSLIMLLPLFSLPPINIRPGHVELRLYRDSKHPQTRRVMFVMDPAVHHHEIRKWSGYDTGASLGR